MWCAQKAESIREPEKPYLVQPQSFAKTPRSDQTSPPDPANSQNPKNPQSKKESLALTPLSARLFAYAPLAQLDRASVYGTEGCWFEPSGVYSKKGTGAALGACPLFRLRKAVSHLFQLGLGLDPVHKTSPRFRLRDRTLDKQSIRPASRCRLQTRPLPTLTPLNQLRPQRIPLNVTQYCEVVSILLNRKGLKTPLPDIATPFEVSMAATHSRQADRN